MLNDEYTIEYLLPDIFKSKYRMENTLLGDGSSGEVYASGKKYAVKKFKNPQSINGLIRELNMYSVCIHPCILKPLNWTIIKNIGYLAMHRGSNIHIAYQENKITMEEIISDTLSVISFMNSIGIAHRDIKPSNIVFHNQKAKIIDMGSASEGHFSEDSSYYFIDTAYTPPFIDPEYVPEQFNSISSEIYALGMTYMCLINPFCMKFGLLYNYSACDDHINWFFNKAKVLQNKRLTIQEIIEEAPKELIVRQYKGIEMKEENIEGNIQSQDMTNWIVSVCYFKNLETKSLFLMINLLNRVFKQLTNNNRLYYHTLYCYILSASIITIVGIILNDIILDTEYWKKESLFNKCQKFEYIYTKTIIDILIYCENRISTKTVWNYAKYKEDLYINASESKSNKCISVRDMISLKYKISNIMNETIEQPCFCNIKVESTFIKRLINSSVDPQSLISILLHNRNILSKLDMNTALKIYETLFNKKTNINVFTLDTICNINWRKKLDRVISEKIFPF